ncbi:NADP-dependent phosphogluconate dehydrogenase [Niabella insulamsoli]|uniref:NADP-dependent phosphogluconate dehydrogenase n=1 Tax=Niabella insulamsoli TaxID=3144874 RepID=UPI0031FD1618
MDAHFGMIGLGTMGRNLVLNIADHGFKVCGYDRSEEQRTRLMEEGKGKPISTASSSAELIRNLKAPRVIMFLVPAGKVVDTVIGELLPDLEKGDILIDGGNSHFVDTDRRYTQLQESGIHFIGMGVSGGEEGARFGPSMMPGGDEDSYQLIANILESIAAKADGEPCVAFVGNGAAGHYVKMVHNGIEYAIMQMISEVYGVLKNEGLSNAELHELFADWNEGELQSFLIEITAEIFRTKDVDTGKDLIDLILDKAKQKGTGLWTSQSALELSVPIPTIDTSVSMRYLSALKEERTQLSEFYVHQNKKTENDTELLKKHCRDALYFGFMMAYGQGLELLETASKNYNYNIHLPTVIKIWRAGCIIRSLLLNDLYDAFVQQPELKNIIGSSVFIPTLKEKRNGLVNLLKVAMDAGVPALTFATTLGYFDAYTQERLSANLIQAQRDFFGAHTYERIDKEGNFHTDWGAKK